MDPRVRTKSQTALMRASVGTFKTQIHDCRPFQINDEDENKIGLTNLSFIFRIYRSIKFGEVFLGEQVVAQKGGKHAETIGM